MTLVGAGPGYVLVNNPLSGKRERWSDALFSYRWKLLGRRALARRRRELRPPRNGHRRLLLEQLDPHVLESACREHPFPGLRCGGLLLTAGDHANRVAEEPDGAGGTSFQQGDDLLEHETPIAWSSESENIMSQITTRPPGRRMRRASASASSLPESSRW